MSDPRHAYLVPPRDMNSWQRDRIKNLGGKCEEKLTEARDLLEAARFWEQAEEGKRWLESLTDEERAERRARQDALDQAFSGR